MGVWQESLYKDDYCERAIQILATGESLAAVCDELGICRATLYNWKNDHSEFAKAINYGLQKCQRDWETMGRDGAMGNLDKFSAPSWIFTMKNRFREDYSEEKKDDKSSAESALEQILSGKVTITPQK